jgi:hypothetical protein
MEKDDNMKDLHWHWPESVTCTDGVLISVMILVVMTLWWRLVTDFRALRRLRLKDDVLTQKRLRFASASVMLEGVMVTFVTACVLLLLKFLYL